MKRREFITLLGGAAAAWPLAARAQQPGKLPTIGFLGAGTPSAPEPWTAAFVQRLRELGWIEGRTVAIEYRWAEGRNERFAEIAAEFVRLKVDVIVTHGTPQSSRQSRRHRRSRSCSRWRATRSAPAWSRAWRDRAAMSPACRFSSPMLAGKRLELLREVVPGLRRLAIMANVGNPAHRAGDARGSGAARTLGLEVATLRNPASRGYRARFRALKGRAEALYVAPIRS